MKLKSSPDEHDLQGQEILVEEISLSYSEIKDRITDLIDDMKPEVLIMTGQAPAPTLRIEKLAVNIANARIAYNCGSKPEDEILEPDGFPAYFSTLPIKDMVMALINAKIPVMTSYSAGTFGCNQIFYQAMHHLDIEELNIPAGFIHVPSLPEQVINQPNTPSMSLETITRGLAIALTTVTKQFTI
jgi:pyroglutamyl-peptidase